MNISEENFKKYLKEAYEAGYYGTLDLVDDTIDHIIKSCEIEKPKTSIKNTNPFISEYLNRDFATNISGEPIFTTYDMSSGSSIIT